MRTIGRKVVRMLSVAAICALPIQGLAATTVGQDQVLSISIKPADGTSGQTVTTGSGVKSGHIQDGAVTSTKIIDSAVTNSKIADGAVGDTKITGPISTSKLNIGSTAGTVAAGDHNHDGLYQKKYANVIVVAKSGGNFTDPVTAVNSVIGASANNPYLIKIMPGVYDIGQNNIAMKEFVDIEGSGEGITTITGNLEGTPGLLQGAANCELRFIKIKNTADWQAYGVIVSGPSPFIKMNKITIEMNESSATTAILNNGDASISDLQIISSNNAIKNNGTISLTKANINSNGVGIYNFGSAVITNSYINAPNGTAVNNNGSLATVSIGNSELIGPIVNGNATLAMKNVAMSGNLTNNGSGVASVYNSIITGSVNNSGPPFVSTLNMGLTQVKSESFFNTGGVFKCFNVYDDNFLPITCQ